MFGGAFAVPAAEAIPAETGKIHHIDILDIGARAQMRDQLSEGCGFQFLAGGVVEVGYGHAVLLLCR